MGLNQSYAIFGLGRYGLAVAEELVSCGAEVLAVDMDEATVNAAAKQIPVCKCADITDAEVIRQLGIRNFDVVVIAMATNLEASVMAITLCKEAGVKKVIAKCGSERHGKILSQVGADEVVFPELESGTRLAKNLISSGFVDMIELSRDVAMVELDVRPEWEGKSPMELNIRRRYGINIVAVRRKNKITVGVDPEEPLTSELSLIVIGNTARLGKLGKK